MRSSGDNINTIKPSLAHTEAMSSTHGVPQDINDWDAEYTGFVNQEHEEHGRQRDFDLDSYGDREASAQEIFATGEYRNRD